MTVLTSVLKELLTKADIIRNAGRGTLTIEIGVNSAGLELAKKIFARKSTTFVYSMQEARELLDEIETAVSTNYAKIGKTLTELLSKGFSPLERGANILPQSGAYIKLILSKKPILTVKRNKPQVIELIKDMQNVGDK